ncbi:glutamate 5-kinase [Rhodovulum sp. DZ06]|uniref:glutamate 5-kinase n=1 Tax=Rhodovulum sp. DZ06 TaxID=3425126 RepID=UPI003D343BF0
MTASADETGMTGMASATPLAHARLVAVKIGSSLLVDQATGTLRKTWLAGLAADIAALRARGCQVIVVSSGAIALGRRPLGLPAGKLAVEQAQAAAAVGQIRLAQGWEEALAPHGIPSAQVLLTLADTHDRRRYLNGRATLKTLLDLGACPVINENDTVATDEIRYGDNDRLAARVALMAEADALALLSDVDGLYTANPRSDASARRLDRIGRITPEIEAMAAGAGSDVGTGGMRTKLLAAKTALSGGCAMAICLGDVDRPLSQLAEGGAATWFVPETSPVNARKRWIAGMKPEGRLVVDAGAARALARGASLLPAGLRGVDGAFERGDPVAIATQEGDAIGAALSGYSSDEARAIAGLQTSQIEAALGHQARAAVAHRDDMVIWDDATAEAAALPSPKPTVPGPRPD